MNYKKNNEGLDGLDREIKKIQKVIRNRERNKKVRFIFL